MSDVPLKQRWIQIGVELEGAWNIPRQKVAEAVRGAKAVKDLSVKIGIGDPGEIITRPHADLDSLCEDIRLLWPDHVHTSCGFHIHASFTPMDTSVIASSAFFEYYKEQWDAWGKKEKLPRNHEFWQRLGGRNTNARDEFSPDKQLIGDGRGAKGSHARYTMLNFYSWEIHRTVESRLLPMFVDREVGVRAVVHQAWIYDSYLNKYGFTPISLPATSQIQGERVLETYEVSTPDTTPLKTEAVSTFPALEMGDNVFYAIPGATDEMHPFRMFSDKQTP